MKLGLLGLGRMGSNMARRLAQGGHFVVIYNRTAEDTRSLAGEQERFIPAYSLEEMVAALEPPRAFWTMVPAGAPTEELISRLAERISAGDIIIDGGNAKFKDSIRRADALAKRGIHFLDVGVSGGIWGLKEGYSLMIGGEEEIVQELRPVFETLAPGKDRGWGRVGPHGAGHFTKMVHNGIEYGMMESLAEGFDLLHSRQELVADPARVAEIWRYGSVVRSWLLDLTADALASNPGLDGVRGWVADSGEGRWTVAEAIDQAVPAPVIALALFRRFASRQEDGYAEKLLAEMRNKFGGHEIRGA